MNNKTIKLALLLASYEADEPHWDQNMFGGEEKNAYYPTYNEEDLHKMLSMDHCGDCVNLPASCPRCWIETILHKAKYLSEHIDEPS